MPADHLAGGGREPRSEKDPPRAENLRGRVRLVSRLPPVGGPGLAAWIKAGYLDFVCPMDYTMSDEEFVSLVRNQVKLIEGRVPLYPGIGATATGISMTADRVMGQVHLARQLGAAGFAIFNFDAGTAASIVPGALAAGRPTQNRMQQE